MSKPERIDLRHETVMDVTEEQIARVYAQAFLGVANKSTNVDELVGELESLVRDVLLGFPQFAEVFRSAQISHDHKVGIIDRVFGGRLSTPVLNFLKVVSHHGRLGLLRPILKIVKKLHAEQRGLTDVEVRVAKELDPGLRSELEGQLRKMLGKVPVLRVTVDPALLGGIILQVGDRVFDASIHTRLEYARRNMIDRATDMIETQPERFMRVSG
jgi:F-type H+-transporting ATPase subunit delta